MEPVEQPPTRRVCERLEDEIVIVHGKTIRDRLVTCQGGGLGDGR
jgi:hypothetical protein